MDYRSLVNVYEELSNNSKRLVKTHILSKFIGSLASEDIEAAILLLQGRLYPVWDERKIGVSSQLVLKAIAKASGAGILKVEEEWKNLGDLGDVAEKVLSKRVSSLSHFGAGGKESLSVKKVFESLRRLAEIEGGGSVDQKVNIIVDLLTSAEGKEPIYLIRTILEDLRVGVAEGTLRDAIAWAYFIDDMAFTYEGDKTVVEDRERYNGVIDLIQRAYDLSNDFGTVASAAKRGKDALISIRIELFKPVKPMLALKAADIEDGFERAGKPCQLEYKYDGFRIQVHKAENKVKLYTRRFEDVTAQFPDVVAAVIDYVRCESCILDSEAVGFERGGERYLPFQKIGQRIKRKYNISEMSEIFPVELNVFDILYHDGKDMLDVPLRERREILDESVVQKKWIIVLSQKNATEDADDAERFYAKALSDGHEGLMIKNLDSPYKPGARVGFMLKLKPTSDPLELVIVGAEWGEGKRKSWLSSFTLACLSDGEFVEIGKMGTGIKEKISEGLSFEEMTALLRPLILEEKGREVRIKPQIVVEVTYQEVQKSPSYSSGYALRFPALKAVRTDRSPDDVADIQDIEDIYFHQK